MGTSDGSARTEKRWLFGIVLLLCGAVLGHRAYRAVLTERAKEAVRFKKKAADEHFKQVKHALGRGDTVSALLWLDKAYSSGNPDPRARFLLPHLTRTLAQTVAVLPHDGEVTSATFVSDGQRVLTTSADGVARLWSVPDGKLVRSLQKIEGALVSAWLASDGKHWVTLDQEGFVRLYDDTHDVPLAVLSDGGKAQPLTMFSMTANAERCVAVAATEKTRGALLFSGQTGALVARLEGHEANVFAALADPTGRRIVTASPKTVKLWDATQGTAVATLAGHQDDVRDAVFSPDGTRVVTSSSDRTARLWDAETGALVAVLEGHQGTVHSASFTLLQGRAVMTVSADGTARLWDKTTGAPMFAPVTHPRRSQMLALTKDGGRMVVLSENSQLELWDRILGHMRGQLLGHAGGVVSISFSQTGSRIVTAGMDGIARIHDGRSGQPLLSLRGHHGRVLSAAFSPDGQLVLTGSKDGTARLSRSQIDEFPRPLLGHASEVVSLAFSPDGQKLLSASREGKAALWDTASADRLAEWPLHGIDEARFVGQKTASLEILTLARGGEGSTGKIPFALRFYDAQSHAQTQTGGGDLSQGAFLAASADGSFLLTDTDGQADLWTRSGPLAPLQKQGPLLQQPTQKTAVVFSRNNRFVAMGSRTGEVSVYDLPRRTPPIALSRHETAVSTVAFSPDETFLATASQDGLVKLHDLAGRRVVATMTGHQGQVRFVQFSPDGTRLLLIDVSERAWLRDGHDGRLIAALPKHTSRAYVDIAMSPDSTRLATCGDDLRVFDLESGEFLVQFDDQAQKDLLTVCVFSPSGSRLAIGTMLGHLSLRDVHVETRPAVAVHQELLGLSAFADLEVKMRKAEVLRQQPKP
ncbi:MAG TPA: WD40 repeat domain-containing protein [Pseudomonadota bacterium]|nr:WD40 repeat domain-containing protein [Pseudomonadota bacterium]